MCIRLNLQVRDGLISLTSSGIGPAIAVDPGDNEVTARIDGDSFIFGGSVRCTRTSRKTRTCGSSSDTLPHRVLFFISGSR